MAFYHSLSNTSAYTYSTVSFGSDGAATTFFATSILFLPFENLLKLEPGFKLVIFGFADLFVSHLVTENLIELEHRIY